ncbi:MAG TPA: chemotaxis protein CheB [Thermoanaerobaculia bacterium]|nr:chemotaxis protein CheB [Thermoanaerobaculia bacterium]
MLSIWSERVGSHRCDRCLRRRHRSASGNHREHAEDGERYKPGVIYIAPPDRHMLIHRNGRRGTLRVVRGPFASAAASVTLSRRSRRCPHKTTSSRRRSGRL